MFHRNIGWLAVDYTALYPRRYKFLYKVDGLKCIICAYYSWEVVWILSLYVCLVRRVWEEIRRKTGEIHNKQSARRDLFAACFMLTPMLAYSSTLKMKTICSSSTSVDFHRTVRRFITEDRTLLNHRCDSLKSNMVCACLSMHPATSCYVNNKRMLFGVSDTCACDRNLDMTVSVRSTQRERPISQSDLQLPYLCELRNALPRYRVADTNTTAKIMIIRRRRRLWR
jgi:hypothetical protein